MSAIHSMPRRFPLSSHLADMYWLCRREQQTPQRCGAVRNPAPAVHVQPRCRSGVQLNPPPQRRPSPPSREAVWRLERLGAGRCAVGNQPPAPTPQTIGDPRGRDPSSPHTICICHAMPTLYLVLLRCEMRCGLLPVRLCQVFIISSYAPHGPASKQRPCAPAATSCCRTRCPLPC